MSVPVRYSFGVNLPERMRTFSPFFAAGLVLAYFCSTSCHVTKTSIMEEPHEKVIGTIQPVLAPFDRRGNVQILLKNVFKYVKNQLILRFSHDAVKKLIKSLQQAVT